MKSAISYHSSVKMQTTENWDKVDIDDEAERLRHFRKMSNKQPHTRSGKIQMYQNIAADYDQLARANTWLSPQMTASRIIAYMLDLDGHRATATTGEEKIISVLDAGCGTGLAGESLRAVWNSAKNNAVSPFHMHGIDLVEDMLRLAGEKSVYDVLSIVDLSSSVSVAALPIFDFIIASGVFYDGHCGPRELSALLSKLAPNGVLSMTVREESFASRREEYMTAVGESEGTVIGNDVLFYKQAGEAPQMANYLVIRKVSL